MVALTGLAVLLLSTSDLLLWNTKPVSHSIIGQQSIYLSPSDHLGLDHKGKVLVRQPGLINAPTAWQGREIIPANWSSSRVTSTCLLRVLFVKKKRRANGNHTQPLYS
ncbi:uncharacterized [Tachysurus ichikawai]